MSKDIEPLFFALDVSSPSCLFFFHLVLTLTYSMNQRMAEVITHVRSGRSPDVGRLTGMHVSVGHYPTLKGIAGALDIGGLEGIPP